MPVLKVFVNVKVEDDKQNKFVEVTSKALAALTQKPEKYIMVKLNPEQKIIFGGDTKPAALLELYCIGLDKQHNEKISKKLAEILKEFFAIPIDRYYLTFTDKEGVNVGYNGGTF